MDAEKICPTCGRSNPRTGRYCGNCGQMLAAAPAQPQWSGEDVFTEAGTVRSPFGAQRAADAPPSRQRAAHPLRSRANQSAGLDPAACGIISFFFPGVGHILCGQAVRGLWIIAGAFVVVHYLHLDAFGFWRVIARLWAALEAHRLAKRLR